MDQEKQNKEEKIDDFLNGDKEDKKEETKKSKCGCGSKLGVVLAIVLTAVLVGGGVYYLMEREFSSMKEKVAEEVRGNIQQKIGDSKKIEDLNKELEQLQEQLVDEKKIVEKEKENNFFSQKMLSYIKDRNMFESDEHKISLTTPENWKISPNTLRDEEVDILSFSVIPSEQVNCGQLNNKETCLDKINFGITQNNGNLPFKEYLNNVLHYSDQFIKDYKEFDFKGKKSYKFINTNAYDGTENVSYWIQLDKNILFYINESYLKEDQKKDFEQIFSNIDF